MNRLLARAKIHLWITPVDVQAAAKLLPFRYSEQRLARAPETSSFFSVKRIAAAADLTAPLRLLLDKFSNPGRPFARLSVSLHCVLSFSLLHHYCSSVLPERRKTQGRPLPLAAGASLLGNRHAYLPV